jgi:PAS domain S-box-containing protein
MDDETKKKAQRIDELTTLRKRAAEGGAFNDNQESHNNMSISDEMFRHFVENANDIVYSLTPDGTFTYVSPNWTEILGHDINKVVGQPIEVFVHPEDISLCRVFLERVIATGKKQAGVEYRVKNEIGTWRWHTTNASPVRDAAGNIVTYMGIARDITERKWVDQTLRESEEKYRQLFELGSDAIFLIDNETGNIMDVNETASQLYGFARNQLMMMNHKDLSAEPEETRRVTLEGKSFVPVRWHRKSDGTVFPVEISARHFIWRGRPAHIAAIRDITARLQAEQLLQQSEKRFRDLAELLPQAVFEFDLQGCFTYANRAAMKIFGYSQADLEKGVNAIDVIAPVDRERAAVNITRISNKDMEIGTEYTALRKNGEEFPVIIYSTPIHADEKVIGLRGIVIDFTERKRAEDEKRRLEERLQRAEKMESLGTMAGGVAHDLNNVLGVVLGYTEMLLLDVTESRSIRPRLMKIMKGGEKAAAIVQDMLTLARRGVPGRQVLNLNRVIAECEQSPEFEKLSTYHPFVKIKTDLEPDLLNISGSPVHLCKSLFNLVSNASEAMKKGGVVTIRTANQYMDKPVYGYDEIMEGDYVVLTVSDTGEGIPKADLKRIFEPFYTKKVMGRSGTGLGLAVVWGTVKDHHGYINVESEEGKGSSFTLYFPVTREDISAEAVALSLSAYIGKGESILVVDDVKEQCDLAAEMLRKLNYNVTTVSSGEEAVAYLQDHTVDLMVLDMIMEPGMDGLDTYRNVRAIHPEQKAIIVSGFSETERVSEAQALGVGAYVRKPYVIETLGLAVRQELGRSR